MYKVYTKRGCKRCDEVKQYLTDKGKEFTEIVIGQDISMEEFRQLFPKVSIVPVVTTQDDIRFTDVNEIQ